MKEEQAKAAQAYADAYRNWHQRKDYSAESMKRFRETREAFLTAWPRACE